MYKMSFPQLLATGIGIIDGVRDGGISNVFSEYLQQQGVNMHDIWKPCLDITENENEINVYFNIPGVDSTSIDVDFFNDKVKVSGNRIQPYVDTDIKHQEIIYGQFERIFKLPVSVTNRDSVKMKYKNGVLVITINKSIEEQNKFTVRLDDIV